MKREPSVIEVLQGPDPFVGAHIASLNMGPAPYRETPTFRHKETGETYLWLAGGIGWPWKGFPGFVAVVAVSNMPGEGADAPLFTCLDELETDRIEDILDGCLRLRNRYGFKQSGTLFQFWYGDPNPFATEVNRFTLKLMKEEPKVHGVHPIAPHDFEKPNHFDLYRRRIKSLGESKSLIVRCASLLNRLQALPEDHDSGDFPAVIALGGVACSLMASTPWTVRTQVAEPTIPAVDDFENYARRYYQDQVPWDRGW